MILVAAAAGMVILKDMRILDQRDIHINQSITEKTWENYHSQIEPMAKKYDVAPEYLLALIALECSGRKIVPHRFEPHVFEKLDQLSRSKLPKMENVVYTDIKGMTVSELRDLASSWGPFQIMGYKCFDIDATIAQLKSAQNLELSVKWIAMSYGDLIRKGDYKNAFHVHNTGRKYPIIGPPRTYHQSYVPRGLKYVDEFVLLLKTQGHDS
ncbi:MAG: hypothetical protein H6608_01145 [Flavobacteriales bacterium]|nr:hypothetical protein [Bacteroidota bacterium]MCB9239713.1 hypothetical protein [Flavobacteriales bacterium]